MYKLALIGNPNCGKTTIFNKLTGAKQKTGNWPGVTVERKKGQFNYQQISFELTDLPGIYSIINSDDDTDSALDEKIAQNFVFHNEADIYINIVNANNLERHLNLTLELKSLGIPSIVILNMMDIATKHKIIIDTEKLSKLLGYPVIAVSATKKLSQKNLIQKIAKNIDTIQVDCCATGVSRLRGNDEAGNRNYQPSSSIEQRYQEVKDILSQCTKDQSTNKFFDEKIDNILLNKFLGLPIFLAITYLMFESAMNLGNAIKPLFDIPSRAIFIDGLGALATNLHLPNALINILTNGIGVGVNTISGFIPQIGLLFLFIALLEDSGYMARAAFIMDRIMQTVGLQGKSFVPLIIGFGCNVPAIMATRHLNSPRDRIITTLMTPFMSCGARLAIFVVFTSAFFPKNPGLMLFILYLVGIIAALVTGAIVNKILLPAKKTFFVLEMPNYHLPQLKNLFLLTWQRLHGFIFRAGKIIIPICVLIGALNSLYLTNSNQTIMEVASRHITPILSPMGIKKDNWPATVGLVTGVLAKEVVIGTLNTLYTTKNTNFTQQKYQFNLKNTAINTFTETKNAFSNLFTIKNLNPLSANEADSQMSTTAMGNMVSSFSNKYAALAYCLFVLLYIPCVSTIGVLAREAGKIWSGVSTFWSINVAYSTAVIFYQSTQLSSDPTTSLLWIITIAIFNICFIYSLKYFIRHISTKSYGKILALKNATNINLCGSGCGGCALKKSVQCH